MSSFFDPFPQIQYGAVTATNIMVRFRVREVLLKYAQVMFEYIVTDGEKPFVVADKYYGRPELSELILLANQAIDPYFDWPMSSREFDAFINKKYGNIRNATQNVHSYWQIIQPRTQLLDGRIIEERSLRVDRSIYLSLVEEERKIVYFYDYEMDRNESKRRISLIKKTYIPQIEAELKLILK